MKLEKAIEILTQCASTYPKGSQSEVLDSFKLGIEALKFVINKRGQPHYLHTGLLPGETKD